MSDVTTEKAGDPPFRLIYRSCNRIEPAHRPSELGKLHSNSGRLSLLVRPSETFEKNCVWLVSIRVTATPIIDVTTSEMISSISVSPDRRRMRRRVRGVKSTSSSASAR